MSSTLPSYDPLQTKHISLYTDPLETFDWQTLVACEGAGAISSFIGTTRDSFNGKKVLRLEYEAYPEGALKKMNEIREYIYNHWEGIHHVLIWHRVGVTPVKEASVVIAVSSTHRKSAIHAVEWAIDTLKETVPIWKREVYEDGSIWKQNTEFIQKHFQ